LPSTIDLKDGLSGCALWYDGNESEVRKKPMMEFIDANLI